MSPEWPESGSQDASPAPVGGGERTPPAEETGERRIGGLSRRSRSEPAAPLARLSRAARQAETPIGETAAQMPAKPQMQATKAPATPGVVAINARISADVRDRARTAFLATQLSEQRTFSEFVERALLDRLAALESQYNEGRPWAPTARALRPGPS